MSAALFSYTHTHKNLKPAFRAKSPFSQAVCYLVSVQPCAGLNEKVYCTLACISTFSSKPAYGEPTMLLVFMNMETRRWNGWLVTYPALYTAFPIDIFFSPFIILLDLLYLPAGWDGMRGSALILRTKEMRWDSVFRIERMLVSIDRQLQL